MVGGLAYKAWQIKKMGEEGIAEELISPVWMDADSKEVEEKDAIGMKVRYRLLHPDRLLQAATQTWRTMDKSKASISLVLF